MLSGRRVLVVGASSGIGRAVALEAARRGARVALAARRSELLAEAASHAGPGALSIRCDVTDETSCKSAVDSTVKELGGLDAFIYAAGTSPLAHVRDTDGRSWQQVLNTNVVGSALVARYSLAHLRESRSPTAIFLSSNSVDPPWPGLGAYVTSKAALNQLAKVLRLEEPWLRVITVTVGPTLTSFADGWDPVDAGRAFERWVADGLLANRVLEPLQVAQLILDTWADPSAGDELLAIGESN